METRGAHRYRCGTAVRQKFHGAKESCNGCTRNAAGVGEPRHDPLLVDQRTPSERECCQGRNSFQAQSKVVTPYSEMMGVHLKGASHPAAGSVAELHMNVPRATCQCLCGKSLTHGVVRTRRVLCPRDQTTGTAQRPNNSEFAHRMLEQSY